MVSETPHIKVERMNLERVLEDALIYLQYPNTPPTPNIWVVTHVSPDGARSLKCITGEFASYPPGHMVWVLANQKDRIIPLPIEPADWDFPAW